LPKHIYCNKGIIANKGLAHLLRGCNPIKSPQFFYFKKKDPRRSPIISDLAVSLTLPAIWINSQRL